VKTAKAANKPSVKVESPKVEINAPITVDVKVIADALQPYFKQMSAAVVEIQDAQIVLNNKLIEMAEQHGKLLNVLRDSKADPFKLEIPERPNNFYVEFDDENGETIGMHINAKPPH